MGHSVLDFKRWFFIGKMEHLGKETINDISMNVDEK